MLLLLFMRTMSIDAKVVFISEHRIDRIVQKVVEKCIVSVYSSSKIDLSNLMINRQ